MHTCRMFLGRREPTSLRRHQNDQNTLKFSQKHHFYATNLARRHQNGQRRRQTLKSGEPKSPPQILVFLQVCCEIFPGLKMEACSYHPLNRNNRGTFELKHFSGVKKIFILVLINQNQQESYSHINKDK